MGQKHSIKKSYSYHYSMLPEIVPVQYAISHSFFVPIFGSTKDTLLFFRQATFLSSSSPIFGFFIVTPESQPISKSMNNTEILSFINTTFTYEERTKYSDLSIPYTANSPKLAPILFLGEQVQLDPIEFNSMFLQQQQQQQTSNHNSMNNNQTLPSINYVKYFLPYPQPANSEDSIYSMPQEENPGVYSNPTPYHPTYKKISPLHGLSLDLPPLQSSTSSLYTLPPPRLIQIIPLEGYPLQRLLTLDLNDTTQVPFHHGATIVIINVIDEESVHSFYNFISQTQKLLSFDCVIDILSVTVHIIIYNTESIDSSLISIPDITTLCAEIGFDSNNIHFHYLDITTDVNQIEYPIQHYTKPSRTTPVSIPDTNASLGFHRTVVNPPPFERSSFIFKKYFQFDKIIHETIEDNIYEIIENNIHAVIWKDIWHKFFDLEYQLYQKEIISNQPQLNESSVTTSTPTSPIPTTISNSLSSTILYQSIQSNPLLQYSLNHFMRIQSSLNQIPLELFYTILSSSYDFDIKSFPQIEQYFTTLTPSDIQLFQCMIQSYQLLQQQPPKSYPDIYYLHHPRQFKLLSNPLPNGLPKSYYLQPNPQYPPLPIEFQEISRKKHAKPLIFSPTLNQTIPQQFQFDSFIRINNRALCHNAQFVQFVQDLQTISQFESKLSTPVVTDTTQSTQPIDITILPQSQLDQLYKDYLKQLQFTSVQRLSSLFRFTNKNESDGNQPVIGFEFDRINQGVPNSTPLSPHYSTRTNAYLYTQTNGIITQIDKVVDNDNDDHSNDDVQQNENDVENNEEDNSTIKLHSTITYQTRFETPLVLESDIKSTPDPITFYPLRYLYGICILPYIFHRNSIPNRTNDQTQSNNEINIESNKECNNDINNECNNECSNEINNEINKEEEFETDNNTSNNNIQSTTIPNPFGYDITLPPFRNSITPIRSTTTSVPDFQELSSNQLTTFGEQFTNLYSFHFNHDAVDWKLYQLSCPIHIVMVCLNPIVNDDELQKESILALLLHTQKIVSLMDQVESNVDFDAMDDTAGIVTKPDIVQLDVYIQPISNTEFHYLQSTLPIQMKDRFIHDVFPFAIQSQGQLNGLEIINDDGTNDITIPTIRDKINDLWTFALITPTDWEQYFYQAELNATQRRITLINEIVKFQSSQM